MNNVFVDGQVSQGTLANFEGHSGGLQLDGNIFAFSATDAVVFETGTLGPEVIRIERNLYFPPPGTLPRFGSGGAVSLAEWRRQSQDNSSVLADPLFRKPGADDYSLRVGSPAFRLGFRPLPLDRVGPRNRLCTCQIQPAGRMFWG